MEDYQLDREWVELILEAKKLGLDQEAVRKFIKEPSITSKIEGGNRYLEK